MAVEKNLVRHDHHCAGLGGRDLFEDRRELGGRFRVERAHRHTGTPGMCGQPLEKPLGRGMFGFITAATSVARGVAVRTISVSFGVRSSFRFAVPVVLPPGLARLSMTPAPTRSL